MLQIQVKPVKRIVFKLQFKILYRERFNRQLLPNNCFFLCIITLVLKMYLSVFLWINSRYAWTEHKFFYLHIFYLTADFPYISIFLLLLCCLFSHIALHDMQKSRVQKVFKQLNLVLLSRFACRLQKRCAGYQTNKKHFKIHLSTLGSYGYLQFIVYTYI